MIERATLVLRAVVVVAVAVLVTFLALPAPTHSQAWDAPRKPNLEGPFTVNDGLMNADRVAAGAWIAPDDVAVDSDGRLYAGTVDGRIMRTRADGSVEPFANTRGRPLGLAFAQDGELYVADAFKGLLRVGVDGTVVPLLNEIEGRPLLYPNQVTVAPSGMVYFTDSSQKWGYGHQAFSVMEQEASGRVLRFDPRTRETTVLLRGLQFANGIAISPDETYALVAETGRYRIWRLWLSGPNANTGEILLDNLPGFPDNLSVTPRGTYWVALHSVRKSLLDRMHPYPFLKDCLASLPEALRPKLDDYGMVFELDRMGNVLRSLHDPLGKRSRSISSAREVDGVLYLGSASLTAIGRVKLQK